MLSFCRSTQLSVCEQLSDLWAVQNKTHTHFRRGYGGNKNMNWFWKHSCQCQWVEFDWRRTTGTSHMVDVTALKAHEGCLQSVLSISLSECPLEGHMCECHTWQGWGIELIGDEGLSLLSFLQPRYHLWSLFILQFAGTYSCGNHRASADHVFKWHTVQVSMSSWKVIFQISVILISWLWIWVW